MKKVCGMNVAKRNFSKTVQKEKMSRELGFAKGEISDLSDSKWEALDAQFNALFSKA
jgi:hypothetical protein